MKFTPKLVRELADEVAEFTKNRFKMGPVGSGEGYGTRYTDAHIDQVWTGGVGARQACAYYINGAMGWAQCTGRDLPEGTERHLKAIYSHLTLKDLEPWAERGRERAAKLALEEGLMVLRDTDGVHMTEGSRQ